MFQEQLPLVPEPLLNRIINVASVPQRSPFRYPGGKTWLVPYIRRWLCFRRETGEFIEPFTGGGIVGLTVAAEKLAACVTMVELDEQVAAVWQTILSDDAAWLARRISSFELTPNSLKEELDKLADSVRERAFQTILKNRTFHGGILAAGSAPLRHGENGKGIRSRWYPDTLAKRILDISQYRERICFHWGDGLHIMRQYSAQEEATFFIDPPYTADGKRAGRRLYTHHEIDHEELFRIASELRGDFLMTYDDAEGVRELARRHKMSTRLVPMKSTHHAEMNELLIGRNLAWLDR